MKNEFPDMTNALMRIRNSARQMDALINGLLKLSRVGRAALDLRPLDMNDLVSSVCSSFDFQVKSLGAELVIGNLPPCRGDMVQVAQIFTNLVDNALKYLYPKRKGKIEISGKVENLCSVYCVKDNGLGIADNYKEKIFELFHRLHPDETNGEGLGLTIIRQILGIIDGKVSVESIPGEGQLVLCFSAIRGNRVRINGGQNEIHRRKNYEKGSDNFDC